MRSLLPQTGRHRFGFGDDARGKPFPPPLGFSLREGERARTLLEGDTAPENVPAFSVIAGLEDQRWFHGSAPEGLILHHARPLFGGASRGSIPLAGIRSAEALPYTTVPRIPTVSLTTEQCRTRNSSSCPVGPNWFDGAPRAHSSAVERRIGGTGCTQAPARESEQQSGGRGFESFCALLSALLSGRSRAAQAAQTASGRSSDGRATGVKPGGSRVRIPPSALDMSLITLKYQILKRDLVAKPNPALPLGQLGREPQRESALWQLLSSFAATTAIRECLGDFALAGERRRRT